MKHAYAGEVRWLSFRLRNGQSIGPAALSAGWSQAAATNGCTVRREAIEGAGVVYALYGPNSLPSPRAAELNMRRFLEDAGYVFTMGSLGGRVAPVA
ncbi:hypothetical protein [Stenotrophomonas sp. 24(2023)]|uniref:hypothetical protein n=1 Tax=Stenotrophomonas sp. 24(2023) TaxID=3068324 RepID=UPI0027DF66BC|nr:hypothetical protein [Stenotrophomonas sp. 24(2023)]WMJ70694.1 hypothetical protein Q9R17_06225 [Stenotrophomonas sp. 24(2023)]